MRHDLPDYFADIGRPHIHSPRAGLGHIIRSFHEQLLGKRIHVAIVEEEDFLYLLVRLRLRVCKPLAGWIVILAIYSKASASSTSAVKAIPLNPGLAPPPWKRK